MICAQRFRCLIDGVRVELTGEVMLLARCRLHRAVARRRVELTGDCFRRHEISLRRLEFHEQRTRLDVFVGVGRSGLTGEVVLLDAGNGLGRGRGIDELLLLCRWWWLLRKAEAVGEHERGLIVEVGQGNGWLVRARGSERRGNVLPTGERRPPAGQTKLDRGAACATVAERRLKEIRCEVRRDFGEVLERVRIARFTESAQLAGVVLQESESVDGEMRCAFSLPL